MVGSLTGNLSSLTKVNWLGALITSANFSIFAFAIAENQVIVSALIQGEGVIQKCSLLGITLRCVYHNALSKKCVYCCRRNKDQTRKIRMEGRRRINGNFWILCPLLRLNASLFSCTPLKVGGYLDVHLEMQRLHFKRLKFSFKFFLIYGI